MSEDIEEKFVQLQQEISLPQAPDVMQIEKRGNRRRFFRQGGGGLLVILILASGIWVAGAVGSESPRRLADPDVAGPESDAIPPGEDQTQPGWIHHSNSDWGVALDTPPDWQATWNQYESVAVANYSFEDAGYCEPGGALTNLPSNGSFFWMFEDSDGEGWGEVDGRPADFELDPASLAPYETLGCRQTYKVVFEDQDRVFIMNVAFGSDAPDDLREQTMEVLDTIEIAPK